MNFIVDSIYPLKSIKVLSCNEEEECIKVKTYINRESKRMKSSLIKISAFLAIITLIEFTPL